MKEQKNNLCAGKFAVIIKKHHQFRKDYMGVREGRNIEVIEWNGMKGK